MDSVVLWRNLVTREGKSEETIVLVIAQQSVLLFSVRISMQKFMELFHSNTGSAAGIQLSNIQNPVPKMSETIGSYSTRS
jgi:hypothetical protein